MKALHALFFLILSCNTMVAMAEQNGMMPFSVLRHYVAYTQSGNLTCPPPEQKWVEGAWVRTCTFKSQLSWPGADLLYPDQTGA